MNLPSPAKLATARGDLDRWGFVTIRGALDAEWVAGHREPIATYVEGHLAEMAADSRAMGASAASPTFSLSDAPPQVAAFVTDPALARIAAALLGAPAVRLLHFCGFFKPPEGSATPWHRDLDFIPLATERVVSAWIPLIPVDPTMGVLAFATGSHKDRSRAAPPQNFPQIASGRLAPGDVSFHLGCTLHSAGPNSSERMREVIAVSFYADGARIAEDDGPAFRAAMREHYFAGLSPGDLAEGPANPIVYVQGEQAA